jgi:hypothetical protein
MVKYILMCEYLTKQVVGYTRGVRHPLLVANDLAPLIAAAESKVCEILQLRNPNCLKSEKWEVKSERHLERVFYIDTSDGDAVRVIIEQVPFTL